MSAGVRRRARDSGRGGRETSRSPVCRGSPGASSLEMVSRGAQSACCEQVACPRGAADTPGLVFLTEGSRASAGLPFQTGLLVTDSVKTLQKK